MAFNMDVAWKITAAVTGLDSVKELQNEMKKLRGSGETLAAGFASIGRLAKGFLAFEAVKIFDKSIIDLGENLDNLKQRTGVSVETLATFKAGAETSGLSLEELAGGFRKLATSALDSLKGTGNAAAVFKALGVNVKDASGNIRPLDSLMFEMSDKFSAFKDGAEKSALASIAFGKNIGDKMIPFLNKGSEELSKFSLNISQSFASKATAFNDSLSIMKNRFLELGAAGIEPLLPKMTAIIEGFAGFIPKIADFFSSAAEAVKPLTDAIYALVAGFYDMIAGIIDLVNQKVNWKSFFDDVRGWVKDLAATVYTLHYGLKDLAEGIVSFGATVALNANPFADKDVLDELTKIREEQKEKNAQDLEAAIDRLVNPAPAVLKVANDNASQRNGIIPKFNPEGLDNDKSAAEELKKYIEQQRQRNLALMQEIDYIGLTTIEIDKMKEARRLDAEVMVKTVNMSPQMKAAFLEQTEAVKQQRLEIMQLNYEQSRTFETGTKQAMAEYVEAIGDAASRARDLWKNAFKGMEDALLSFVKSGKVNFDSLASSIIDDLIRMQIQRNITSPIAKFISSFNPASFLSQFSTGGVMTGSGSLPLHKYASGGIASSPQMAIFGEGRLPEAYVPLPDGRSIPVTMKNGGGNIVNNINITISSDGSAQASGDNQSATKLGQLMAATAKSVIINELRPNGVITRQMAA